MSLDTTPIQIVPKIARWSKKGGKLKRGSNARKEGPKRVRHYTWLLVQNARALGFINGVRIEQKGRGHHAAV